MNFFTAECFSIHLRVIYKTTFLFQCVMKLQFALLWRLRCRGEWGRHNVAENLGTFYIARISMHLDRTFWTKTFINRRVNFVSAPDVTRFVHHPQHTAPNKSNFDSFYRTVLLITLLLNTPLLIPLLELANQWKDIIRLHKERGAVCRWWVACLHKTSKNSVPNLLYRTKIIVIYFKSYTAAK